MIVQYVLFIYITMIRRLLVIYGSQFIDNKCF